MSGGRRTRHAAILACFVAAALQAAPTQLQAQPRASERGTVSQVVNGTRITVDYSRPVARGRDNLIGGVVHWGEMWTPGANWATTLEVSSDVTIDGHPLPAGAYSVWMQPQPEAWTVFLNTETRLYHDSPVPEDRHALTFTVEAQEGVHMESLAWYFPAVDGRRAELRVHWGPTYVPLQIEVPAYEMPTLSAAEHPGYLGSYAVSGTDPTIGSPLELTLGVVDDEGTLMGRWGPAPIALIPAGEHEFYIGFMRGGELFDAGTEMTVRLVMDGDVARSVEMVWEGDRVFARGDRIPDP